MSRESHELFTRQLDAKNREIYENLQALRGEYRAHLASEFANMMLNMKAQAIIGVPEGIRTRMSIVVTYIIMALCTHEKWDPDEFIGEVEAFVGARYHASDLS